MSELSNCKLMRRKTKIKPSRQRAKRAQREGIGIALPYSNPGLQEGGDERHAPVALTAGQTPGTNGT